MQVTIAEFRTKIKHLLELGEPFDLVNGKTGKVLATVTPGVSDPISSQKSSIPVVKPTKKATKSPITPIVSTSIQSSIYFVPAPKKD